jgi:hypothetical protein
MKEDAGRPGRSSRGTEEAGHWPGRRSRGALDVGDARGWASGG